MESISQPTALKYVLLSILRMFLIHRMKNIAELKTHKCDVISSIVTFVVCFQLFFRSGMYSKIILKCSFWITFGVSNNLVTRAQSG